MNKIKQSILAVVIGLALAAGVSFASYTWTGAPGNPAVPNADAPINVGPSTQSKSGAMNFNSVVQFNASTPMIIKANAGSHKVLTSDQYGNAGWENPPQITPPPSPYIPMIDVKSKICSGSADCEITCNSGYTVISGGFRGEKQIASYPIKSSNSWHTTAFDYGSTNDTTIYVLCIK